eukprot:scaffold52316_cov18-Tisochrysis_lutea.AAC.3
MSDAVLSSMTQRNLLTLNHQFYLERPHPNGKISTWFFCLRGGTEMTREGVYGRNKEERLEEKKEIIANNHSVSDWVQARVSGIG